MNLSVIIPVFNRAHCVCESLQSIVDQQIPCTEIVVVDDASTDDSLAQVQSFAAHSTIPIRLLTREINGGIGAARNAGIRAAMCEWIGFLDSDDLWTPDKLARQQAALASAPLAAICTCDFEEFFAPDYTPDPQARLKAEAGLLCGGMICRREVFTVAGLFDESLRAGEFIEWLPRARGAGMRECHVAARLLRRRVHGENASRGAEARSHYLRAVRLALGRARTRPQLPPLTDAP